MTDGKGLAVAIHPNQVAALRPRFTAAGGKSDSFDSFVLAELARTDSHRYRILVPDSDQTKALGALTDHADGDTFGSLFRDPTAADTTTPGPTTSTSASAPATSTTRTPSGALAACERLIPTSRALCP